MPDDKYTTPTKHEEKLESQKRKHEEARKAGDSGEGAAGTPVQGAGGGGGSRSRSRSRSPYQRNARRRLTFNRRRVSRRRVSRRRVSRRRVSRRRVSKRRSNKRRVSKRRVSRRRMSKRRVSRRRVSRRRSSRRRVSRRRVSRRSQELRKRLGYNMEPPPTPRKPPPRAPQKRPRPSEESRVGGGGIQEMPLPIDKKYEMWVNPYLDPNTGDPLPNPDQLVRAQNTEMENMYNQF